MRQADLIKYMEELDSPTCARLRFEVSKEHGILPNEVRFLGRKAILICKRSERGEDFSVSQGGVNYCIHLENETPGVQSYVLLVDRENNFVAQTTARDFIRRMNGIAPRPSDDVRYGPY